MGIGALLLGVALMVASIAAPQLSWIEKLIVGVVGAVIFLLGVALHMFTLYRKATANQAFVRTGLGGARVVMDGAAIVLPMFHRTLEVNLQTMKLGVNPKGRNALITRDNLRADVLAQFYIKVQPDDDHILMASRSLGESSVNAETIEALVSEKLVSALRAIASQMDLFEIHTKRDEFAEKVKEHVRADLEANGLLLESVTISELDQTDPKELSDNNVFDAQGKKKITEITAAAAVERNKLDRDAERQRTEKDVETRQFVLELERKKAEAEASQMAQIAKVKAAKEQEAQEAEISRSQAIATAQVSQQKAVQEAEISRDQAVQVAQVAQELAVKAAEIQRDRSLQIATAERDQSVKTAQVEQERAVALADRARQIAIAEQETARAKAEEAALLAEVERERAKQQVTTVEQLAEADREAQKKLIAAKQGIEQDKIAQQTSAEVQAYTRVKQAEAEQESAAKQASARLQLAQAEAESRKLVAEGETAVQMVPVQVERERVNVHGAEVNVEAQELENRQKFAQAGIELEIQKLRISADKDVQIAMAEAIGRALSSSKMTLFGSPEMAATMLQSMAKGMGARSLMEGFTGPLTNGAGHNGNGTPLESMVDMIAPLVQRFTGKTVDAKTLADLTAVVQNQQTPPIAPMVADAPLESKIPGAPNGPVPTETVGAKGAEKKSAGA
ncbi:MAG TPA: SPFH domain-containing protein [Armatimonadota bacterium]|nr:SPFH domain-containing protein [Armatimonadota bacterium]